MDGARYTLQARGLARTFGRTELFRGLDLSLETGESLCVTGPNGSGKSTLLMILAGLLAPTEGSVGHAAGAGIPRDRWHAHIGYTGPMVHPYDELTALENIEFALGDQAGAARARALLDDFDLSRHAEKKLKHYSSGMKQRLKIVLALVNDPPVLILDEPGTNLDDAGRELLASRIESVRKGKIILLATNDAREATLCDRGIRLG